MDTAVEDHEINPFPINIVIPSKDVDERMPDGKFLLEVFESGHIHVAFRQDPWDSWPVGVFLNAPPRNR